MTSLHGEVGVLLKETYRHGSDTRGPSATLRARGAGVEGEDEEREEGKGGGGSGKAGGGEEERMNKERRKENMFNLLSVYGKMLKLKFQS